MVRASHKFVYAGVGQDLVQFAADVDAVSIDRAGSIVWAGPTPGPWIAGGPPRQ